MYVMLNFLNTSVTQN